MRTCEILENNNCSLLKIFRTASGIVLFERGAIGFSSSIAFQNALNNQNQTITSEITLFLVIATICARFVISVFFSSVIDHVPPTQIRRYYGMILTNYGRPLLNGATQYFIPHSDWHPTPTQQQQYSAESGPFLGHVYVLLRQLCSSPESEDRARATPRIAKATKISNPTRISYLV